MAYPLENLLRRPVAFIPAGVFYLAALGIVLSPETFLLPPVMVYLLAVVLMLSGQGMQIARAAQRARQRPIVPGDSRGTIAPRRPEHPWLIFRQKQKWLSLAEALRDGASITQVAKRLRVAQHVVPLAPSLHGTAQVRAGSDTHGHCRSG